MNIINLIALDDFGRKIISSTHISDYDIDVLLKDVGLNIYIGKNLLKEQMVNSQMTNIYLLKNKPSFSIEDKFLIDINKKTDKEIILFLGMFLKGALKPGFIGIDIYDITSIIKNNHIGYFVCNSFNEEDNYKNVIDELIKKLPHKLETYEDLYVVMGGIKSLYECHSIIEEIRKIYNMNILYAWYDDSGDRHIMVFASKPPLPLKAKSEIIKDLPDWLKKK